MQEPRPSGCIWGCKAQPSLLMQILLGFFYSSFVPRARDRTVLHGLVTEVLMVIAPAEKCKKTRHLHGQSIRVKHFIIDEGNAN